MIRGERLVTSSLNRVQKIQPPIEDCPTDEDTPLEFDQSNVTVKEKPAVEKPIPSRIDTNKQSLHQLRKS